MEELLESFKHWLNNLYRKHHWTLIAAPFVGMAVIAGICWIITKYDDNNEILINILATIIGVFFAYLILRIIFLFSHFNEDKNKVSYSNEDMNNQYGDEYRQNFTLNNSSFTVYCEKLLQFKQGMKLLVQDDPDAYFSLDSFIKSQFYTLIEAHAMSKTTNSVTVRLKQVEQPFNANIAIMRTMRSTYLSHMLTNRALDYQIKPGISIRSLFENTNHLVPLQRSRLSNHLGVNALVFLEGKSDEKLKYDDKIDKWLLLPQRGKNATVAKGNVTASIATRLQMDNKDIFPNTYLDHLTADYILKGCIKDSIADAIQISSATKYLSDDNIHFLGISRDIYEGGKPTLFYVVYLNMNIDTYSKLHGEYVPKDPNQLDAVNKIHIAEWEKVKMQQTFTNKQRLSFTDYQGKEYFVLYEQNLIANFWFLKGCPTNNFISE